MTPQEFIDHANGFWDEVKKSALEDKQSINGQVNIARELLDMYWTVAPIKEHLKYDALRFKFMGVLEAKGKEYSTDSDKLHNFKRAASVAEEYGIKISPAQSAFFFQLKHLVSIHDLVDGLRPEFTHDQMLEKFGDAINYCILIDALETEYKQTNK